MKRICTITLTDDNNETIFKIAVTANKLDFAKEKLREYCRDCGFDGDDLEEEVADLWDNYENENGDHLAFRWFDFYDDED